MPFVIKDLSTNEYICSSASKSIDKTDVRYAKVYSEKGAKSALNYIQNLLDHHWRTNEILVSEEYIGYQSYTKPNLVILEIK